jgi:hypothetical protein
LPQKNKDSSVKTSKLSPNKFDRKLKQISAESKSRQNDAEIDDYVVINDGTFPDDDDYVDLNGQNVLEIEN